MGFFRNIWKKIKAFFTKAEEEVAMFATDAVRYVAANGGSILINAAMSAVLAAEQTGKTGPEKFDIAKKTVLNELKTNGVPVVAAAVNNALEMAVARLKN